jgi:hypothetical protein
MNSKVAKLGLAMGIFMWGLLFSDAVRAQVAGANLSGTITEPSGTVVTNARVSVKNLTTEQSVETQTDSAGRYNVSNVMPGDYELSVSAAGYSTNTIKVTMAAGSDKSVNLTLGGVLSQARLDKRSHMLKIHQRLGLIAAVPLAATVIAGTGAGGKSTSSSDRYLHLALGSAAGDLYFMSAYYAIRAPRIPGTQTRGQIRFHKALAWIHGPGMILTPILGAIAFDQKSKGEKVHGIASAHGPVAIVTAAAYGAAILSVSVKF